MVLLINPASQLIACPLQLVLCPGPFIYSDLDAVTWKGRDSNVFITAVEFHLRKCENSLYGAESALMQHAYVILPEE